MVRDLCFIGKDNTSSGLLVESHLDLLSLVFNDLPVCQLSRIINIDDIEFGLLLSTLLSSCLDVIKYLLTLSYWIIFISVIMKSSSNHFRFNSFRNLVSTNLHVLLEIVGRTRSNDISMLVSQNNDVRLLGNFIKLWVFWVCVFLCYTHLFAYRLFDFKLSWILAWSSNSFLPELNFDLIIQKLLEHVILTNIALSFVRMLLFLFKDCQFLFSSYHFFDPVRYCWQLSFWHFQTFMT